MNENKKLEQEFLSLIKEAGEKAKEHKPSKERLNRRIDANLKLNKELQKTKRKSFYFGILDTILSRKYMKPALAIAASFVTIFIGYVYYNSNQSKYPSPAPQLTNVPILDSNSILTQQKADTISPDINDYAKPEAGKSYQQKQVHRSILHAETIKKSNDALGFADNELPVEMEQIFDEFEIRINTTLGHRLIFEQSNDSKTSEWFYITGSQGDEHSRGRLILSSRNDSLFLVLEKTFVGLIQKDNLKSINIDNLKYFE